MTVFYPDVSNNNWGDEQLTLTGHRNLMNFLSACRGGGFAGICHKMSQGTGYVDPYGAVCQTWCEYQNFPFLGFHFATTDPVDEQVDNWLAAGGKVNVMIDFEQMSDDEPILEPQQFWDLTNAFNERYVNVALAYIPEWYAQRITMDLTPLASNDIVLASSAYPDDSQGNQPSGNAYAIYSSVGGDTGEGWAGYLGALPGIWQYTNQATIGGFNVDCNAYHGTLSNLFGMIPITPT